MNLTQKIESYLFMTGRSSLKNIASVFSVTIDQVSESIDQIQKSLEGHGIMLVNDNHDVLLATIPEASEWMDEIRKQELSTPLSKGAYETLAIILYQNGASKPEIDYVRGVNSQFMIRNLLMRGLIEKTNDPIDKRISRYMPTLEVLKFLGLTSMDQLPDRDYFTTLMNQALSTPESDLSGSTDENNDATITQTQEVE